MAGQNTYRYVVYDVLTTMQSAFPDADINANHILYWARTVENLIRKRHLNKLESGAYLSQFANVPVLKDGIRHYIELPSAIYDLAFEKGIKYITHQRSTSIAFTHTLFQPTSQSESFRLYYSPYEVPSPSNPYFYRVNSRIYFLGVENIKLPTVEMGLYTAIDPRSSQVNLDDTINLNEDQVAQLRIELLNMGRYMLMIPSERDMEGADTRTEGSPGVSRSTITSNNRNQQPQEEQIETTPE